MQAVPTTGIAQGIQYIEKACLNASNAEISGPIASVDQKPVVVCCFGDGSVTEGEVSEAFQFAALRQLPIIYLVEDNDWGISVSSDEARTMNAYEFIQGFKGIERLQVDGSDFAKSYEVIENAIHYVREHRKPVLVHASVPLLGHHTSGVRKEWYRTEEDMAKHLKNDPAPKLKKELLKQGVSESELEQIEHEEKEFVLREFAEAVDSPEPNPLSVGHYVFADTPITEEKGIRVPANGEKVVMVDAALHAIEEIMRRHPECIFYGQDVGKRLGGVFREAATLADKFGDDRVFNTAIQEAYIIGSTIGLSAVGIKAFVEVQFADYIYPGINQLVTEISKSCYLSCGKFPVSMVLRVPIGAYGGGGPYHSGSVESILANIKGIKVCYPSNAADLKGLLKAAYYDPNPVVMLEHKGLYYWAKNAAKKYPGSVEVIDIRTIYPLDEELIFSTVRKHGKCMVLTEEQLRNSFAEALACRIAQACFYQLDAPVKTVGAMDLPAVPMNVILEQAMLPTTEKVEVAIGELLNY